MKSHIDLLNTSFILHSDEGNEYIQGLVAYIKTKIEDVQEDVNVTDSLRTAVLTLLLITHELQSTKKELHNTSNYAYHSVKRILSQLPPNDSSPSSVSNTIINTDTSSLHETEDIPYNFDTDDINISTKEEEEYVDEEDVFLKEI